MKFRDFMVFWLTIIALKIIGALPAASWVVVLSPWIFLAVLSLFIAGCAGFGGSGWWR